MFELSEALYRIQKSDISKGGTVLADAFSNDPFWKKVLENATDVQRSKFFESSIRYCQMYGEVYAPSEKIEGVAAWTTDKNADMTILRSIRSGSFLLLFKVGFSTMRFLMQMDKIFGPLEKMRKETMKGRQYLYLVIIGIAPVFQGQGFGKKILSVLFQKSKKLNLPIYLETTTEINIKIYQKLGFNVTGEITLPIINMPQWGMLREPGI